MSETNPSGPEAMRDLLFPAGDWHVFTVPTGRELAGAQALNEWGSAEGYCPVRRYWKQTNRMRKGRRLRELREDALYPGYLFARLDASCVALSVAVAKAGARAWLEVDRQPCRVSPSLIAKLRRAEETGLYDETLEETRRFAALIGRKVRVPSGPLAGFIALITAPIGQRTVRGEVDLGNTTAKVTIDAEELCSGEAA